MLPKQNRQEIIPNGRKEVFDSHLGESFQLLAHCSLGLQRLVRVENGVLSIDCLSVSL